mmetsp:Transcript_17326/g.31531  ORF Transcript_17326/g.31531 Transcript_17326/m.31531 type:complete len:126 (+) Transcript_17326:369-746(+)
MKEGEIGEITLTLRSMEAPDGTDAKEGLPMVVAIVGVPSSLEVDDARLKLIKKEGLVDFYERMGATEMVFYWRGMAYGAEKKVVIPVTASIPGTYTGRSSRAYLYYESEKKSWVPPLEVEVEPAA